MITRLDHCVIAVRDLAQTRKHFERRLLLSSYPGGKHTGLGTENTIVRFGLDYLELIGIYDRQEVMAAGVKRAALLEFLERREGGLLGYALATDDIDNLAERFRKTGLDAFGPYAMQRTRPDGQTLKWRLLVPSGTAWRRPWPFFIQWDLADDERLQLEQPGDHALGASAVAGVAITVSDLEAAQYLYSHQLGLSLAEEADEPALGTRRVRYRIKDFSIDLWRRSGMGLSETMKMKMERVYMRLPSL